ncbi:MAG: L-serine ammonia-lyase, iron-sulfur-dependent, subunit alpha [Treponema sp.]|jgi:L-cysteine desulfidase|nr:L-serine ammonia-lyase, iron-sulfur-dependent, subunit alpha [Treponema sp.]
MLANEPKYIRYVELLRKELIPATGCTEPVAIAYAAALARNELETLPDKVVTEVSGNILKNVKGVVVPNTGGLKGVKAAAAAGIIAGDSEKILSVISAVSEKQKEELCSYLKEASFSVNLVDKGQLFDIIITLYAGSSYAKVRISDFHTNVVLIEKNGKIIFSSEKKIDSTETASDVSMELSLNVDSIIDFADTVRLEDVEDLIARQIAFNSAISNEGLKGNYGANIGKLLRNNYGDDIKTRAKAAAAAGSDARMSGCEMPVIIVTGSGNQGMTASLPVIEYANEWGKSRESLIRALVLSDLMTVHLKSGIGTLSAYCGVVSAGAAAGAGIAYLHGGRKKEISQTVVNALAIVSGIVCDGAKPSCAAKIVSAVDAGIMGFEMYNNGQQFCPGDGLVAADVEDTIRNIGRLGKEGMKTTDTEIIKMMMDE